MAVVFGSLGVSAQTQDNYAQDNHSPKPQEYDSLFLEAMVQRQKGNADETVELLNKCVEINPEASEAYYYLAIYKNLKDGNDEAMALIEKAVALDSTNAVYMETLMQAHIGKRQYKDAAMIAERLYDQHKDREDLLELLFQIYQHEQEWDNAISILNRLEAINGKSERLSYSKSEIYARKGDNTAAISEMKELSERYPNDMGYLCIYGDMLMMNNETDKALAIYDRIQREEPENTKVQVSLFNYYREASLNETADTILERLLTNPTVDTEQKILLLRQEILRAEELGGDSTRILSLFDKMMAQPQEDSSIGSLCAAYMSLKGMPKDSIAKVLEYILDIEPDNAAARLQLVSYAWSDDDNDRVIALCNDARQYNPEEMAFYYYQGMAYYKQEKKDQALSAFQNGIGVINEESDANIVSDFYAVMGDLLHQKGMVKEAFAAYDSCLQWKEDNIMCLNNYAYYLSERGEQLDKAEQMSYKTVTAEPKNPTYLDTYAWILFMQKRYAESKIYIEQALRNDSDSNAVIIEHAGDIFIMNKDLERALELWQQALLLDKDNKILARKIKQKKYIRQ